MDFEKYEELFKTLSSQYTAVLERDLASLHNQKIRLEQELEDILASLHNQKIRLEQELEDIKAALRTCRATRNKGIITASNEVLQAFKEDVFKELPAIENHENKEAIFLSVWEKCDKDKERTFEELKELSRLFCST